MADRPADLRLTATDENIRLSDAEHVGEPEAELYAMTIPLSEQLPGLGRMMTHGVAIAYKGKSYIFTAESGVGKSTRAFLWQKYLGPDKVRIINGDKPILWFRDDAVYACGSPWSGKEHLDENVCVPLGGICLLKRLDTDPEGGNRIVKATPGEALDFLLHQTFIPANPSAQIKTFQLLEELFARVPVYHLITDLSEEGVKVAAETLVRD